METDTTYNGWSNRETWAFVLHCDNTIGAEFIIESLGDLESISSEFVSVWETGQYIIDMVGEMWDESRSHDWVQLMRDDVGGLWYVNPKEVGEWAHEHAEGMREAAS